MKLQVKSRWAAALRSGMFQQTEGVLKNSKGHCCLGVLCELHAEETGTQFIGYPNTAAQCYLGALEYLPHAVADWAGLRQIDPSIKYEMEDRWFGSLSDLNDHGIPFEKIADIIEEQL